MADLKYEKQYYKKGKKTIVGVDEAGRGPLAGPLVVAAVILPKNYKNDEINDSKQLSDNKRRELFIEIIKNALDYKIEIIDTLDIERFNIYQATKLGMIKAIKGLSITPDFILSDAMPLDCGIECLPLIKGDALSLSIAAASILAKVTRDDLMIEYDKIYPQYDFKNNKGYGTTKHLEAIKIYGVLPIHRRGFEPIKSILQPSLFEENEVFN